MKKLLLIAALICSFVYPQKSHAIDTKGKAFLIICTYGTVGGALLGFASMAFGTNSRAIAQGASLGLYAGIAFGSYVIASHNRGQDEFVDPSYQQPQSPPPGFGQGGFGQPAGGFGAPPPMQDDMQGGGAGFGAPEEESGGGGFFGQRVQEINDDLFYNYRLKNNKGRGLSLPIYVPILNVQF